MSDEKYIEDLIHFIASMHVISKEDKDNIFSIIQNNNPPPDFDRKIKDLLQLEADYLQKKETLIDQELTKVKQQQAEQNPQIIAQLKNILTTYETQAQEILKDYKNELNEWENRFDKKMQEIQSTEEELAQDQIRKNLGI